MAPHTHEVVPVDGTTRYPPRDQELHRRLVYGDETALGEAYDAYGALVRAVARRVSGSAAVADEVTHRVFIELWTCPFAFAPGHGSLRAWLSMRGHRGAVDRVREARAERAECGPARETAPEPAEEARTALHAALAELPLPEREALHLACFAGRTYRQVAVELGIADTAATARLRSALSALADRLTGPPAAPGSPAGEARDEC
ncbi:sigma-70 family RNA polymerase sigma factor [Streptomyces albofaciens JCM 4342]|uniref:RNA polymerase sigma factor n=1 Tax=Streptomyces albofaciens TaxID=66866 RepID=UPI001239B9A2|nr:sigma-70 family RNA polymerase sigma factor [Streptomyces albofaciens]KAA6222594.1 sigma-70 family RNA polymerase sigma factor [Streptomyces albofaciens JCM 4342]